MQVVDINGNVFGTGLEVTGPDGKPKTISGGGGPTGPAGGDLSGESVGAGGLAVRGRGSAGAKHAGICAGMAAPCGDLGRPDLALDGGGDLGVSRGREVLIRHGTKRDA